MINTNPTGRDTTEVAVQRLSQKLITKLNLQNSSRVFEDDSNNISAHDSVPRALSKLNAALTAFDLSNRQDAEPIDASKSYSEGEIVYAEGASWRVAAGGANAGDLPSTHPDKFTVLSSLTQADLDAKQDLLTEGAFQDGDKTKLDDAVTSGNSALLGYTHKAETAFNEILSKNIVGELNSGNLPVISGDHTLITGNNVTSIGGYANMFQTQTVGALVIPDSVTSIGSYAFYANGITSLDMGNGVTTTSLSSFSGCSSLTSITLSNSLVTIGGSCFANCSNITGSLIIPDSVTTISSSAFNTCSGFTGDLTIPDSVTSIGSYAFRSCSGLTNVNCYVTRTIMNATNCLFLTGVTTLHAQSGKGWTAGADTIGGKALTVIIDL